MTRLSEVRNIPNISDELCGEIDSAERRMKEFSNASILKNFGAITVESLVKRCKEYSELYTKFEELYIEYQAYVKTKILKFGHLSVIRKMLLN